MREIKFRVWDNVDYMSTPFTFHDLMVKDVGFTSDCHVLQYTGLKDKYGVEIYEGDIMACYDWGGKNEFVGNFSMEWDIDENGWNFRPYWVEDRYDFRKAISHSEVIGNIYETPELLTP